MEITISEDAKRGWEAGLLFKGSRDFLLAHELLGKRRDEPDVRAFRAPWPIQAYVTCASLALELALKCRIVLDRKVPANTHSYSVLFGQLSRVAQDDVVSMFPAPATADDLIGILTELEGTFVNWRYLNERSARLEQTVFHEGKMVTLIHTLHDCIVGMRPDFAPWPGIIVDPASSASPSE